MVCGSIGYGGVQEIRRIYHLLSIEGFEVLNHIEAEGMDYSDIEDFRNKRELSSKIVSHDLEYVKKTDVMIVLSNNPSYGTAIEMYVAKNSGKKIILLAKKPVPTPWPIHFSDYVVSDEKELIKVLHELDNKRTIQT